MKTAVHGYNAFRHYPSIPMKKTIAIAAAASLLVASCSFPSFSGEASYCECPDGSGKFGPKGEKCGEILQERIGAQGYYGELEVAKVPAYFSQNCRSEP